ncbi:hypothetical protein JTB14_010300 [Gonioctena quinquepunctata]|nr:hypothetical protein JTB14_010300 [Gonioctena quinquepunctata]
MSQEIPIPTIVKDLEYFISSLPISEEEKNNLRGTTTNTITYFYTNNKVNRMSREYQETVRFSKQHPEMIVMKSDEGNSTVVMFEDLERTG